MIYGEMIHNLHPDHKIKLVYDERPYICHGCHEYGFGSRYSCDDPFSSCNFHLHKCCAQPEPTLTHPFFPNSVFSPFFSRPFFSRFQQLGEVHRYCDACGGSIKGLVYHCFRKDRDLHLHPSCATLQDTLMINVGDKKLVLKLKRKSSSKCDKCHKKEVIKNMKSWVYVSTDKDCHLHIGCVTDLLCEAWEDKFLKGGDGKRFDDKIETKAMGKGATEPDLHIVLDKGKKQRGGGFKKCKVIGKIVYFGTISIITGNPSGLVGLISSSLN